MEIEINVRLGEYFGELEDPRRDQTQRHLLLDIVVITICAVISGADDFEAVAAFGVAKEEWLRRFLALPPPGGATSRKRHLQEVPPPGSPTSWL